MMKWKNKSLAIVSIAHEKERYRKSRERSFETKVNKIKTLMTENTRVARTGRENDGTKTKTKEAKVIDPKTKPKNQTRKQIVSIE
jgi:ribosomal protein L23